MAGRLATSCNGGRGLAVALCDAMERYVIGTDCWDDRAKAEPDLAAGTGATGGTTGQDNVVHGGDGNAG